MQLLCSTRDCLGYQLRFILANVIKCVGLGNLKSSESNVHSVLLRPHQLTFAVLWWIEAFDTHTIGECDVSDVGVEMDVACCCGHNPVIRTSASTVAVRLQRVACYD